MKTSFRISIVLAFFLALSNCAPSRDVRPKLTTRDRTLYEINSCTFTYEQGGNSRNNLNSINIVQSDFGKFYDQNQVAAVLGASAKKTVEYIQAHNVAVYGVQRPSKGCHNLISLPRAEGNLLEFWNYIDGEERGPFVLGVFLPSSRANGFGINQPLIVVRTDADRWTLIHEFMHFLYADYRQKSHGFNEERFVQSWQVLNQEVAPKLAVFDPQQAKIDSEYRNNMAGMYLEYGRSAQIFLRNFPLEEMVIESILFGYLEKGQFLGATDFHRKNSTGYIHQNYVKATLLMKDLVTLGRAIQASFPNSEGFYSNLQKELKKIENLAQETLQLRSKFYPNPAMTLTGGEIEVETHVAYGFGCGHSHDNLDLPYRLLKD